MDQSDNPSTDLLAHVTAFEGRQNHDYTEYAWHELENHR
jgi:hypothetical protein